MIASAVDGAVYLAEGNYAMAAMCFLDAVIPAVGIVGKALTTTCKYARVGKTIETGAKVANGIFNLARGMYNADKAVGSFCERHKDDLFTENFKWTKEDTLDAFSFGMAALTCVSSGKSLAKDLDNFMAAGDDLATLGASVGCFVAGTLIRTLEDEKKLEDIQEGDLVLSYEASEGIFASKEVLEVVAHEGVTELAHVTIGEDTADGAYTGTETIDSTTNHPYFVVGYGFVEAGNLRPGDTILLANGENRKVDSVEIEFLDDLVTVYNFEVADWHTYFVGNTGVLVHNANIQACSDAVASAGGNGKATGGAGEGGSKTVDVKLSKKKYPESAQHIEEAIKEGQPDTLTIDRGGASARRKASLKGVDTVPGLDRDEYPPAMSMEGGSGASVKLINPSDNRGSGSYVSGQLRKYPNGTKYRIIITDED